MESQTIIRTQDVDELFIYTVVRLIKRRAFLNLRNIIAKTHSADDVIGIFAYFMLANLFLF